MNDFEQPQKQKVPTDRDIFEKGWAQTLIDMYDRGDMDLSDLRRVCKETMLFDYLPEDIKNLLTSQEP